MRNGISFLWESQPMPVTRVCQHSQELKSGPLANIYKQEINIQFRIRYIMFTDTGIVGLLHSYREFHEDIPRSSCPQERHDNSQYEHSHFIPSIKKYQKQNQKPEHLPLLRTCGWLTASIPSAQLHWISRMETARFLSSIFDPLQAAGSCLWSAMTWTIWLSLTALSFDLGDVRQDWSRCCQCYKATFWTRFSLT